MKLSPYTQDVSMGNMRDQNGPLQPAYPQITKKNFLQIATSAADYLSK